MNWGLRQFLTPWVLGLNINYEKRGYGDGKYCSIYKVDNNLKSGKQRVGCINLKIIESKERIL